MLPVLARLVALWLCVVMSTHAVASSLDASNIPTPSLKEKQVREEKTLPEVNLAFGIMLYHKKGQDPAYTARHFQRLMASIYRPDRHLYMLHIDAKTDAALMHTLHNEADSAGRAPNCGYIRPRNVAWGAPSVVEMNMALMQAAYEFPDLQYEYTDAHQKHRSSTAQGQGHGRQRQRLPYMWDYFVFIGHESVPLVSLGYIEQWFASVVHGVRPSASASSSNALGGGKAVVSDNVVDDEESKSQLEELFYVYPAGTNFINCWDGFGHDFFGQYEDVVERLKKVVVEVPEGHLVEELYRKDRSGKFHEFRRSIPEVGDLHVYKTIQYVTLTREACKYLLYGPESRRVMLYLANVKASDELIIPTIFQTSEKLRRTASCDTTLTFTHWARPGGSWHPEYLTMEHLPVILNTSTNLFARKVDDSSLEVLQSLDEIQNATRIWEDLALHVRSSAMHLNSAQVDVQMEGDGSSHSDAGREAGIGVKSAVQVLVPPLQLQHVLNAIPHSVIKRGVYHVLKVAVGMAVPRSEYQIDAPESASQVSAWTEGSARETAVSVLQSHIFSDFPWFSHNEGKDTEDQDQAPAPKAPKKVTTIDLWRLWQAWHEDGDKAGLSTEHVTIHAVLAALDLIRQRRDDIQAQEFRDYWMAHWERKKEAAAATRTKNKS